MSIDFTINLDGNMSGNLIVINNHFGATEKKAKQAAKGLQMLDAEVGKLGSSVGGLGFNFEAIAKGEGSFFTFDLAEGFKAALEVIEAVVGAVWDLGKAMVKTAGETSDINLALDLTFGEKGAADVKALGDAFQQKSRFNSEEIQKMLLPLGALGIKDKDTLGLLATAATDIAAFSGKGHTAAEAAITALTNVQTRGTVNKGMFKALFIDQTTFYKDLAEEMGTTADAAKKLATKGGIGATKLLDFTMREIAKREGTPGVLGTATEKSANTLGGALDRLGQLSGNLLRDIGESPAFAQLGVVLNNFVNIMNGPEGKEFTRTISEGLVDLGHLFLDPFSSTDGVKNMTESVRSMVGYVKDAVEWIRQWKKDSDDANERLKAFGQTIDEWVIKPLQRLNEALNLGNLVAGSNPVVSNIINGWVRGSNSATGDVKEATVSLGKEGVIEPLQSTFDMHSPSLVMAELGANVAEGFAIGMGRGKGSVESASRRALTSTVMGTDIDASAPDITRGGSTVINLAVDVTVNTTASDGASVGYETAQTVRTEIKKLLDEIGFANGATTNT